MPTPRRYGLLLIGIASVFAYAYTGGPYPLAYVGLGDVFVVLFFGLIAVTMGYLHGLVLDGLIVLNALRTFINNLLSSITSETAMSTAPVESELALFASVQCLAETASPHPVISAFLTIINALSIQSSIAWSPCTSFTWY